MAREPSVAGELPSGIVAFPSAKVRAPLETRARPGSVMPARCDSGWDELRDRLVDRWPVLTAGELYATHGDAALVEALIEAKLAYGRRSSTRPSGHGSCAPPVPAAGPAAGS